jgi:hypothetical protein
LIIFTLIVPIVRGDSNVFWSGTFTLRGGSGDYFNCDLNAQSGWNAANYLVTGTISVTGGKVDFFILNATQWAKYSSQTGAKRSSSCAVWRPVESDVAVLGISSSYSVHHLIPDNNNHTFMVLNAYIYDAVVTVNLVWAPG